MLATSTEWADVKARWVAALRSGDYTQGKGALMRPEGTNCCLGVLCDVLGRRVETFDPDVATYGSSGDLEVNSDAYKLARDLIPKYHGPLGGSTVDHLMSMNDANYDEAKSFEDIADWIEENL